MPSISLAIIIRVVVALMLALLLSLHGWRKKSLDFSGCITACLVGFVGVATSYRNGILLLSFYYSSSKLTKLKEDVKASLEEDYAPGGQRNWIQVLANSLLSTALAVVYYWFIGEDQNILFSAISGDHVTLFGKHFSKSFLASQLACMYVAHFATANGDTWASEVGILSPTQPRLVTSCFTKVVPAGTNGGMSLQGTCASILGGGFIGVLHWIMSWLSDGNALQLLKQYPIILFGCFCGFLGSLLDSLLGATLQASYYNKDSKKIVKHINPRSHADPSIVHLCGTDILSNETVNFVSIAMTMIISWFIAPAFFCALSNSHCS
jgi:uncharacterized membrane protein